MAGGMIQMHSLLLWGECVGTCVLSAAVYAELVALLICAADGGVPSRIPKPLLQAFMVLWTCPCAILPSSVQFAMPDAASFPFSHIGERYQHFSFFYCKILLLNIPWPFLVPCAFSPYLPRMPLHRVHPQQLCGQGRTRGSGWCAEEQSVGPEGPRETWGFSQQKLPEAQQRDMQSPALRVGKPHCIDPGWKPTGWAALLERTQGYSRCCVEYDPRCALTAKKANHTLGYLRHSRGRRSKDVVIPLYSVPGMSCLDTMSSQSWASPTEMVLGVNLWRSLPEDAKGADSSHGLKKRGDATTEDRSAGNTFMEEKSAWKNG